MIEKVISGGQIGADQAGLRAAKACGIPTGGSINKGWRTLLGSQPELAAYGLEEISSYAYPVRTKRNVEDSDGTVRFASAWNSPGELCTARCLRETEKPVFNVTVPEQVNERRIYEFIQWVRLHEVRILNVAGNAWKGQPENGELVEWFLCKAFGLMDQEEQS